MKIFYTGIGCNQTGEHSEKEFLDIMNREFTNRNWRLELLRYPREYNCQLQFKEWVLPNEFVLFTLYDWIEYSGAELVESSFSE